MHPEDVGKIYVICKNMKKLHLYISWPTDQPPIFHADPIRFEWDVNHLLNGIQTYLSQVISNRIPDKIVFVPRFQTQKLTSCE